MMAELQQLQTTLEPSETLFVVDSMQGQNALSVAAEFNKSVKLSGVVLTKVDGDSRGEPCCLFGQLRDAPSDSSATQKNLMDLNCLMRQGLRIEF